MQPLLFLMHCCPKSALHCYAVRHSPLLLAYTVMTYLEFEMQALGSSVFLANKSA